MPLPSRYTALGWVVAKVAVPMAKKKARERARQKTEAAKRSAANNKPRIALGVGSALGVTAYLVKQRRRSRKRRGDDL